MGKTLIKVAIGAAIIGAAFLTGGASLLPTISTVGGIGGVAGLGAVTIAGGLSTTFLGGLALSLGASTILGGISGALAKTPKTSLSTLDRLNASLVPSAPRKIAFGRTAMATDIRYIEPSGSDQEYIDYIIAVAAHRVDSIEELWLEDLLAWTSTGGITAKYAGYLTIDTRTEGTSANTIAINGGGSWGANRRLTGCAYIHLRIKRTGNSKKAESPFSGGLPSRMTIIGQGLPVYDPRYDSTVAGGSGPQRVDDQSTWRFLYDGRSQGWTPPLQILAYLLGWEINGKLSVGRGIPPARIDLASFAVAANLCDEGVTKADGTVETRYRSACVVSEGDDPQSVLGALTASCNARLRDAGGKLSITVLHNDLAAAAADDGLNDDDVLSAFTWNPDPSLEQSYNIVRGRYTDPSPNSLYQLVDYPEISLASVDGIDRVLTLDLANVESPAQAQRLAKTNLQRKQYQRSFSATFGARAWRYQVGDIVPLTFSALGFNRRLFRVEQQTIQMDGSCPMVLTEENAAIYAWDAEDAAAVQAADPVRYDPLNSPLILGIDQASETAIWTSITGTGKPEDDATVGAPAGTDVAGVPAATLVASVASLSDILVPSGEVFSAIAAIEAQTRQGSPNLLSRGDFRDGLSGWTAAGSGWFVVIGFPIGPFVQNSSGAAGDLIYRDVAVSAGTSYSLSAEMDPDAAGTMEIHGEWRDAGDAHISDTAAIVGDDWTRTAIAASAAPTGATKIRIYVIRTASGGSIRATRIQFQAGEATAWNSAASDYEVTTRITTEETARQGETAALATRATILEAQVDGTGASGLKALITTNATAATDATTAVAADVTQLTARVRQGSPNLLAGSDFASGLAHWTVDGTGWVVVGGFSIGAFAQNSGNAGDFLRQDVPAQAGTSYSLSAEMDPDAFGAIRTYVDWLNSGGSVIANALIVQGDSWQRVAAAAVTAPTGTVGARIRVHQVSAGVIGRITRIQFQEGDATDYRADQSLGVLQAQVTTLAGVQADQSGKLEAWLENTVAVPGATAAVVLKASTGGGGSTSSVALLAKKLFFIDDDDDPSTAELAMDITSVDGVPQMNFYGNIAAQRVVSAENLDYGATGNVSKYYFQPLNDNNQTDWSAGPMGVGIVSQEGAPIEGRAIMTATNIGTAGGVTHLKVIRTSDGVAVYGGDDGIPYKFPSDGTYMSVPIEFMDSVPAGVRAQYDVRVKQTGGADTRTIMRMETIREMVRDKFDEIWIVAPLGEGPGAGTGGGGQINGDTSGDGDTGGTAASGGNAGYTGGGLRAKTVDAS